MTHNRRISDRCQVPHRPWPRTPTPEQENTRSVGRMLLWVVTVGLILYALLFWAFFSYITPAVVATGALPNDGPEIVWVCRTDSECEQEERAYEEGKACSISDDRLLCK